MEDRRVKRAPQWTSFIWDGRQFNARWLGMHHPSMRKKPADARQFLWGTDMAGRRFHQLWNGTLANMQITQNAEDTLNDLHAAYGPIVAEYPRMGETVIMMYHKGQEDNVHPGTADTDDIAHGIDILDGSGRSVVLHPLRTLVYNDDFRRPTGLLAARVGVMSPNINNSNSGSSVINF